MKELVGHYINRLIESSGFVTDMQTPPPPPPKKKKSKKKARKR